MELDSTTLIFEDLPKNKDVILVANSYIYKKQSDYYVLALFKEQNKLEQNYYLSFIPLKAIFQFPLGAVFKNQQYIRKNCINNLFKANIDIEPKRYTTIAAKNIFSLYNIFDERFPNNLKEITNIKDMVSNQNHIILKDNLSNKNIIFPCYEIARWFYMRSSSLTRQLMSCYLEGLYHKVEYTDEDKRYGEINLKYGSSNNDIAEIFRFAKNKFSNTMFIDFSMSILSTMIKVNDFNSEEFDTRLTFNCSFPIYGNINFKFYGFNIDSTNIYVYQILEEDTKYPFESIIAYREKQTSKAKEQDGEQTINKNKPLENQEKYIVSSKNPHNENDVIELNNTSDYIDNLRTDLLKKKISYEQIIEKNETESSTKTKYEKNNLEAKISFNDILSKENEDCFSSSFNNVPKPSGLNIKEYFKQLDKMINQILLNKDISLVSSDVLDMPLKPKKDFSKRQYKRSYLKNKKIRKYARLILETKEFNVVIIEIERDELFDAMSTVILLSKQKLEELYIHRLMLTYSKFNGQWIVSKKLVEKINFLNHPKKYDTESIKNWAKRLENKLK